VPDHHCPDILLQWWSGTSFVGISISSISVFISEEFTEQIYESLGISIWQDLLEGPKRMQLPEIAWEDKNFETPSGKFEFYSERALRNGKSPMAHYTFSRHEGRVDRFLMLSNHEQFSLNSQFQNLELLEKEKKEPTVYIHPVSASMKGISDGSWVHVFNDNGEIKLKCLLSSVVHPSVLLVKANHDLVNRLISFTPTDMGEVSSGYEGMAFNSTYVNIEKIDIIS
jgi:anaerobic selenocysteine-containing dehydrogenase